jgi:hypothetical protein
VPADLVKIGVVLFEQLGQNMFDLDIIIRSRKAEPGRALERIPAHVVQSAYK